MRCAPGRWGFDAYSQLQIAECRVKNPLAPKENDGWTWNDGFVTLVLLKKKQEINWFLRGYDLVFNGSMRQNHTVTVKEPFMGRFKFSVCDIQVRDVILRCLRDKFGVKNVPVFSCISLCFSGIKYNIREEFAIVCHRSYLRMV